MGFTPTEMDWNVAAFAAAVTLFTVMFFGLIPALRCSRAAAKSRRRTQGSERLS